MQVSNHKHVQMPGGPLQGVCEGDGGVSVCWGAEERRVADLAGKDAQIREFRAEMEAIIGTLTRLAAQQPAPAAH